VIAFFCLNQLCRHPYAIANALLEKLSIKQVGELRTKQTKNIAAYEYYLKGEYFHLNKFHVTLRIDDFKKSEDMFKKAIELDPNYAVAYAGLADLYNTYTFSIEDDKKYIDLQRNYIETAFRLNPTSARVYRAKGVVHAYLKEANDQYESYKRALQLNPNDSANNWSMGFFLRACGLHHHAIKYYTKAIELDPLISTKYRSRASAYRRLGDFEQAILDYQKALEVEPDDISALNSFAWSLIHLKKYSEAEEHLAKSEKIKPDYPRNESTRILLYAVRGKKKEALQSLERGDYKNSRYFKIIIYCVLGLKDEAVKLIDKRPFADPFNAVGSDYINMLNNPFFDILRDTAEFEVALREAKKIYEENLLKYGEVFL